MVVTASSTLEQKLYKEGVLLVAGIDEVGRGALAGPLVAGCVILPLDHRLGLADSKLISAKKRTSIAEQIRSSAVGFGLGWVSNTEIDEFGLAWCLQEAYLRALENMHLEVSHIILDGSVDYLKEFEICQTMVKADQKVNCVAAASILAKVARDNYMQSLCEQYPEYCYDTNVGYGTKAHREALSKHGLTDIHRKSFCRQFK
ncbi:MAG: ribonuclease HII [Candidatus Saccharibacteria bacterium]